MYHFISGSSGGRMGAKREVGGRKGRVNGEEKMETSAKKGGLKDSASQYLGKNLRQDSES